MSFEGLGGLFTLAGMALYGTAVLTGYALKGAGWLLYHGGKAAYHGVKGAAGAIRSAHAAAEERRREEALEELRSVEGAMARSTEALMADISRVEKEAETARLAAVRKMDAEWESSIKALEAKADHADEALLALREFHTKRTRELTESLRVETAALEKRLETACSEMSDRAVKMVEAQSTAAMAALDKAEGTMEERNARYLNYARQALREAKAMLEWIEKHYDCETFAGAELVRARSAIQGVEEAIASGACANAAGNAAAATSAVQTLQVYAEQRTASFNRAKATVQAAAAELMDMVEASRTLLHEGDPEQLAEFVSEEYDAAYWSQGRLEALWKKAEELTARADAFAPGSTSADLVIEAQQLRLQLIDEYTRTRQFVVSKQHVVQLAMQIIESHQENGWELSEDPGYLGGDSRNDLRLVFMRGGDRRDVTIRNVYDAAAGLYKQQIVRHVEEAGIPDEETRRRDDEAINQSMSERGVAEEMHVKCDRATAGLKGSI